MNEKCLHNAKSKPSLASEWWYCLLSATPPSTDFLFRCVFNNGKNHFKLVTVRDERNMSSKYRWKNEVGVSTKIVLSTRRRLGKRNSDFLWMPRKRWAIGEMFQRSTFKNMWASIEWWNYFWSATPSRGQTAKLGTQVRFLTVKTRKRIVSDETCQ